MEAASKLIGTGKKLLVMGKPVEAVSSLQEACALLAKEYGDTADECGEAFFWCGKALLDLARMENSVLGNALEGVPEDDEDEDKDSPKDSNVESTENVDEKTRDELRVQVYDAMAEKKNEGEEGDGKTVKSEADQRGETEEEKVGEMNSENEKTDQKSAAEEKESDTKHKAVDQEKEAALKEEESADEEEEAADDQGGEVEMEDGEELGDDDPTGEKDAEDEDVGNLQLAWEMLEVAKVIYKRKDTKEDQLMAAQAHLKLGEVSAESGNYTQALEDFRECLELQRTHLDSDSRLLAETHYQLGVTYGLNLQYGRAIEALNESISVIKSRLERLQEMLDKAGPEALPDERKEMEELKALLPEIQEKVEDAAEGLKTTTAVLKGMQDESVSCELADSPVSVGGSSSISAVKSPSVPVSDISHLVRKKRKPEESPVKEGEAKRVKQDDGNAGSNGVHKANGDCNGLAEKAEVEQ